MHHMTEVLSIHIQMRLTLCTARISIACSSPLHAPTASASKTWDLGFSEPRPCAMIAPSRYIAYPYAIFVPFLWHSDPSEKTVRTSGGSFNHHRLKASAAAALLIPRVGSVRQFCV